VSSVGVCAEMWLFVYGFLASLAAGYGAQLRAGGPGHAAYFGDLQGFHVPHFPMPSWFVTIDVWLKINKVRPLKTVDLGGCFCMF
jgi:hypothetical protein